MTNLIKEQIQLTLPNCTVLNNELIGLDIPNFGRLTISKSLDISIKYKLEKDIDFALFKVFFEKRLKFPGTGLYIKEDSISLYKRALKNKSSFESAMHYANIFIKTVEVINQFLSYIEEKNL